MHVQQGVIQLAHQHLQLQIGGRPQLLLQVEEGRFTGRKVPAVFDAIAGVYRVDIVGLRLLIGFDQPREGVQPRAAFSIKYRGAHHLVEQRQRVGDFFLAEGDLFLVKEQLILLLAVQRGADIAADGVAEVDLVGPLFHVVEFLDADGRNQRSQQQNKGKSGTQLPADVEVLDATFNAVNHFYYFPVTR